MHSRNCWNNHLITFRYNYSFIVLYILSFYTYLLLRESAAVEFCVDFVITKHSEISKNDDDNVDADSGDNDVMS